MTRNQISTYLKSAVSIALMSVAFCCWILLCVWVFQNLDTHKSGFGLIGSSPAVAVSTPQTKPASPVKITNELRYTTMGWQNPSHWVRQPTQVSQLSVSGVHPIVLGIAILLASLLGVILCSPDQEVERLLRAARLRDQSTPSYKLNKLRELNRD